MSFLEILVRAPVCVYDTEGNIRDWLHHYHHHSPGVIDGRKGFPWVSPYYFILMAPVSLVRIYAVALTVTLM
jgi:hypothetical protein